MKTRYWVLLAVIFAWFAFPRAAHYGQIWESTVHPIPNVEVTLKSGEKARGALSQAWRSFDSKPEWVLTQDNGQQLHFVDFIELSSIPAMNRELPLPWRRLVVQFGVFAVFMGLLVFGFREVWTRPRASQSI